MTDFRAEREIVCRVQCIRDHLDKVEELLQESEPSKGAMRKEYHYDFGVFWITEEQAKGLFDKIIELVEDMDASTGGGYTEYVEADETTEDES